MVDVTPAPRLYAHTLADRSMVYQPEVVKGKLPVTIGHQYSAALLGLEVEEGMSSSWVLPLLNQRVSTVQDKEWLAPTKSRHCYEMRSCHLVGYSPSKSGTVGIASRPISTLDFGQSALASTDIELRENLYN